MSFPFFNIARAETESPLQKIKKWFILLSYNPSIFEITPLTAKGFDMAILDADHHPLLDDLKNHMILIGYVSLGEAEGYREYWERIKDKSWILEENPNWKENHIVDIRNPEWQKLIIDEVIPAMISKGFQGTELDTIDTAEYLEALDSEKYRGAKKAMVEFIRNIRKQYPDFLLISNNGFGILEEIAPYINGCLVESVFYTIDLETNKYKETPGGESTEKTEILQKIIKQYNLPVFDIEYVSRKDKKNISKSIKKSKKSGFKPYAAEKDLSEIYPQ